MWRVLTPVLLFACAGIDLDELTEQLCAGCDATCAYDEPAVRSASHVDGGVDYPQLPPAGGDHDPCWAEWGVHDTDPGAEHWVHNLEHGGVVFLYDCPGDCPDEVAELEGLAAELPQGTVIVAPLAGMPTQFAAVAWGRRLTTDCLVVEGMRDFYDQFADRAPESVTAAPPAGCVETGTGSG